MGCTIVEKNRIKYLKLAPAGQVIAHSEDGLALISLCWAHEVDRVLLLQGCLSNDFMRLSTGIAGEVLQKLSNYGIRAAAVLDMAETKGKFKDFLLETNRGGIFRAYDSVERAEAWLVEGECT